MRAAHRARGPVRGRRREPDRLREPRDGRPPLPPRPRALARARATSCWPPSTWPRPATASSARTRAACAAGSTSRRALVARPPVLFLDEPTTGLDIAQPDRALGRDRGAGRASGTTVLLTTQYLDEADRLADRIAVIDHGLVIAEGHAGRAEDPGRRRAARDPPLRRRSAARRRSSRSPRSPATARSSRTGRCACRHRAPRDDRRRGPAPRRGRDRDRRHRGRHADARRRLPDADRPRGRARRSEQTEVARR